MTRSVRKSVQKSQPRGSRRKMKRFRLEEISSVDKPAQEGALAMLMKRKSDGGNDALVRKIVDHYLANRTGFASFTHSQIAKRAGVEEAEPSWPFFAALETSLHSIVADGSINDEVRLRLMKSAAEDFLKAAKDELPEIETYLGKGLSEGEMTLAQLRKQMTALSQKVDTVVPKLEAIISKVSKQEFEKEGFLEEEDDEGDEDEEGAADRLRSLLDKADDSMMEMDEYTAEAEVDKNVDYPEEEKPTSEGEEEETIAAGDTEPIGGGRASKRASFGGNTITIGSRTITKAAIGADMFALLKSQQDEVEQLRKRADDERDARQLVEFAKVADEQLGHLPGTAEQKARVLKQLSTSLDKEDRQVLTRMLKAGNGGMRAAFSTVGTRYGKAASATDFSKRVAEIRSRDNCSNREAMQKARREHPEAFAEYQGN